MSADIIKAIPRPTRDDLKTDFPKFAFRTARHEPAGDPVDAVRNQCSGSANREA